MQNYCIVQFLGGLKSIRRTLKEISLAMKLLFILLICSAGLAYASDGYAQKTSITLRVNDCTIEEVLHKIERESGFSFFIIARILTLIAGYRFQLPRRIFFRCWNRSLQVQMSNIKYWIIRLY